MKFKSDFLTSNFIQDWMLKIFNQSFKHVSFHNDVKLLKRVKFLGFLVLFMNITKRETRPGVDRDKPNVWY